MTRSVVLATAAIFAAAGLFAQTADTILLNGKNLTADTAFSTQQALAVRGRRKIAATGTTAEMKRLAGPAPA